MKRLNLGCGTDTKEGYVNVDVRPGPGVDVVGDLSRTPWSWADETVDEVMMLDFLEHFPYRDTDKILNECWRILVPQGMLVVQVPDLEHCARAASMLKPYLCNACGWEFPEVDLRANFFMCDKCGQSAVDVAEAAVKRLYGGQDYPGNFHYTAFSKIMLDRRLQKIGFDRIEEVEYDHQFANWNFKLKAYKKDPWE